MKQLIGFKEINGIFSLKRLKPAFIQFAKTDISDLLNLKKEDVDNLYRNCNVKAIGRITPNPMQKSPNSMPNNFMRCPF